MGAGRQTDEQKKRQRRRRWKKEGFDVDVIRFSRLLSGNNSLITNKADSYQPLGIIDTNLLQSSECILVI